MSAQYDVAIDRGDVGRELLLPRDRGAQCLQASQFSVELVESAGRAPQVDAILDGFAFRDADELEVRRARRRPGHGADPSVVHFRSAPAERIAPERGDGSRVGAVDGDADQVHPRMVARAATDEFTQRLPSKWS